MDTPLMLAIAAGSLVAVMTFTMSAIFITRGDRSAEIEDPWLEEEAA
jgi:hypothetical protein